MSQQTVEIEFVVEPNYDGWRLDKYLCVKIRRLSRTRVQRIIERDVQGGLKASTRIERGQVIKIRRSMLAEPDDISDGVVWLASELSRTVTGTQLTLDMGATKV